MANEIVVGTSLPKTGQYAETQFLQYSRAYDQWVRDVNASGGQTHEVTAVEAPQRYGHGISASPGRPSTARSKGSSGSLAGPLRMPPVAASKRDPWHGQSQDFSSLLQRTTQPRWVHRALCAHSLPSPVR